MIINESILRAAGITNMTKGMLEACKHYLRHKEISEQLHMSEDAVNKQIKRSLNTLRVKLGLFLVFIFPFPRFSKQRAP